MSEYPIPENLRHLYSHAEGPMIVTQSLLNSLIERIADLTAEVERLKKELSFRDFARARESDIALHHGPYGEIQKALSSEIALHEAWVKRANEAEAEVERLKAPVSDEDAERSFHIWNGVCVDATKWDELDEVDQDRWKRAITAARARRHNDSLLLS